MKNRIFLFLLTIGLLTACSTGQGTAVDLPLEATGTTPQFQPTLNSLSEATSLPAANNPAPVQTFTPKPPLAEDAWKQMPAVPTGIGDSMRAVYEKGLALGNDPKHFSIIGDCQNVSSYFLSVYAKSGEFSLGQEYTYLQPTIDYYQDSR
jgi:hypothetical protein